MIGVGNEGEMSRSLFFDASPFLNILEMQNTFGYVSTFEGDCERGGREVGASHE